MNACVERTGKLDPESSIYFKPKGLVLSMTSPTPLQHTVLEGELNISELQTGPILNGIQRRVCVDFQKETHRFLTHSPMNIAILDLLKQEDGLGDVRKESKYNLRDVVRNWD